VSVNHLQLARREDARLEACVLEQIHTPGSIQPHGAMVTVDPTTFTILQASNNCGDLLAVAALDLVGTPLLDLVGAAAAEQFRQILNWEGFGANPVPVTIAERSFDAIFHDADGVGIVEFEPRSPSPHHSATAIYSALHRLAGASTADDLLTWTARELRRLTEFEQVMVYRFHPDDHGEVVAEACAPGVQSYFGQHFPASDIPIQARRLYLKKMSRVIVITATDEVPLVPAENPLTGGPVDLGLAELRAISPRHIQFMTNMGQASTMSFSLVHGGELIGMITCADRTVKHIPYALRQGYEVLARQVALQWGAMDHIDRLTHRDRLRVVRQDLSEQVRDAASLGHALTRQGLTICDLVRADAGAVRVDGRTFVVGESVDAVRAGMFFNYLDETGRGSFSSEELTRDHPDLSDVMPGMAGAAVVRFGTPGDYLAWFRREQVRTVDWIGDQTVGNRSTPLSPRNSFEMWSESVSGTSQPWDELELLEAVELSRDLDSALLNRM
jgi:chemotaxis family two-component system sensor kinase Cph1